MQENEEIQPNRDDFDHRIVRHRVSILVESRAAIAKHQWDIPYEVYDQKENQKQTRETHNEFPSG